VIVADKPREGSTIRCRECDTDLEVVSASPFEVDYPVDYDDDWDDDNWDDESNA
jgi:hypothetical protein